MPSAVIHRLPPPRSRQPAGCGGSLPAQSVPHPGVPMPVLMAKGERAR
ncbi:hypothetical protein K4B79_20480 [Streptomyces lincolnensis]|nr:hypothetical protein [Streptomyces lincolnensis]MCD7440589.1 hypothetical protein [Streptomyces lincolnensis]